ncbi:HEAT repeat domain-containing protein [Achromobacter pestifer]|uniref:HEAT repeat domain-containing protein n=1 Tax=Achromobacter pestifer TaxID=1353889 RepID=A0A7D4E0K3_9BURK|nr:HEAT repeat domain-containing protein [Achromobacter pestifer]QKH38468.1 HEAT repeat domain-containing protein [Achromobacter pestifer]
MSKKTAAAPTGRGVKDISAERLAQLNADEPAGNLTECLAVDFAELMQAAAPQVGAEAVAALRAQAAMGISKRMAAAAHLLQEGLGRDAFQQLRNHRSDTVRGWACFMVGAMPDLTLTQRLALIRPLADDAHFGVREWAWLALRPQLAAELDKALDLLRPWTADSSERVRRYACESLRPRGVWCAHIAALKAEPGRALPLLEPLRADPAVYVQDSVANWLNDASKDQPDWVREICARWSKGEPAQATQRICKRALRSIGA